MPIKVKPSATLDSIYIGEDEQYEITCTDILDGDTIKTVTVTYTDEDGEDVTENFEGGDSNADGVITLGMIGYSAGTYTIEVDVTCNEKLPDNSTERNFIFYLYITIE